MSDSDYSILYNDNFQNIHNLENNRFNYENHYIKWEENYNVSDYSESKFRLEQQIIIEQSKEIIYNIEHVKIKTEVDICLEILDNIEYDMRTFFPTGRHEFQIRMHTEILKLCVYKLLGNNFNRYKAEVCKRRGWVRIPKDCFVIAARKSGKTIALYYGLAAVMMNMEEIEIVQFSPGTTQSREILNAVRRILSTEAKNGDYLLKRNAGLDTIRLVNDTKYKACSLRAISGHPSAINVSINISFFLFLKM